jgi:hypothetical protein
MGVWIEILKLGARGERLAAREKLASELPLTLREFVPSSQRERQYRGPLPQAVQRFAANLPESERALAQSRACDFVDYILEDVCAEVERTLLLVELCHAQPQATLDELQAVFPWTPGLKRSDEWKKERLTDYLRSFVAIGVNLPAPIMNKVEAGNTPVLPFNEIAYAVTPKRLEQSWQDFKEQMEWSDRFLGLVTEEDETSSAAECFDYGAISAARLHTGFAPVTEAEIGLELLLLGRELSPELNILLEELHAAAAFDGYRPIAWHNVFWNITSEYDYLPLQLEQRDPLRETDQELATHLAAQYPEVKSTSRPVVSRRRKKLYDACTERVIRRLRENFAAAQEQAA